MKIFLQLLHGIQLRMGQHRQNFDDPSTDDCLDFRHRSMATERRDNAPQVYKMASDRDELRAPFPLASRRTH
jgi:hypothetical protein